MSDRMEYQVALQKDGIFDTYKSASLLVASDDNAIDKAKAWAIRLTTRRKTPGFRL